MATSTGKPLSFRVSIPQSSNIGPRRGHLAFNGRAPVDTPHFIPASSRGAVPHLSQDMMREQSPLKSMYTALEDSSPQQSPLRKFIALQRDALLILGPRRVPPLPCPASSTSTAISIVTSLGFSMLESEDYVEAVQKLRPDIVIGMGDVLFGHIPGAKRLDRMGDRTLAWVNDLVKGMEDPDAGTPNTALFAPILPIDKEWQKWYFDGLMDELKEKISGLVLYEASIDAVPQHMDHLPRLYIGHLVGPHKLLDAIAQGIDVFTIPFINEATDAGIALHFSLVGSIPTDQSQVSTDKESLPLGLDLWSPSYATDLSPLREGCACYACKSHHRAYVQHLLNAKEMLAWVLLQVHNHHTMDVFFGEIRRSIEQGTFENDRIAFQRTYQRELPAKSGQGPRARGYTFKSEGKGEPRRNPLAWSRELNDGKEKLADSALPDADIDTAELERKGFAEKAES